MASSSEDALVLVAGPWQGHINPMIQLSICLSTLYRVEFIASLTPTVRIPPPPDDRITIHPIELIPSTANPLVQSELLFTMLLQQKPKIVQRVFDHLATGSKSKIRAVVYDTYVSWGLDLAKRLDVPGIALYPAPIGYAVLSLAMESGSDVTNEAFPTLTAAQWKESPIPVIRDSIFESIRLLNCADMIFVNDHPSLYPENNVVACVNELCRRLGWPPDDPRVHLIGLLVDADPRKLDENFDETITNWLSVHPPKSVIYISMGTIFNLGFKSAQALAQALVESDRPVLWVFRPGESATYSTQQLMRCLSINANTEKVQVIPWVNQIQVLGHQSIGLFVTHCGWNSVTESILFSREGLPILLLPVCADQLMIAEMLSNEKGPRIAIRPADCVDDASPPLSAEAIHKALADLTNPDEGFAARANDLKSKLGHSTLQRKKAFEALQTLIGSRDLSKSK